jgi:hypothetical protein
LCLLQSRCCADYTTVEVDPIEDGGLGLDPATAATMVGHDDDGT